MNIDGQLCNIVPAKELGARIHDFQSRLKHRGLDGALVIQKADLFYYTGTTQTGWLYVPEQGDAVFMVFKNVERARAETHLPVIPVLSPKKIPEILTGEDLALQNPGHGAGCAAGIPVSDVPGDFQYRCHSGCVCRNPVPAGREILL
jgi:Xaa-Pro aminopeptidase